MIAVDLFCGKGGWTIGLQQAGWKNVIGFDIADMGGYPGQLVLQDILTIDGKQFKNVDLIVASPPCTEYSYMAMPWTRGKQIARALRGQGEFPDPYEGSLSIAELNALFDACFRIQREASEAAGRHIPMVVENVKGAQPWVGSASWHYGSFYLWGDVPALMPHTFRGFKTVGHVNKRDGHNHTRHLTNQAESDGVKQPGLSGRAWLDQGIASLPSGSRGTKGGGDWFGSGENCSQQRRESSRSPQRKEASARIAMIPPDLARHIGQVYLDGL